MKTLVIGYGNVTRRDDGVGVWIAEKIAAKKIEGVTVRTVQQLHMEFVEECLPFDRVLLIDARVSGKPVTLQEVQSRDMPATMSSSHFLDGRYIKALAWRLYGKSLELYVCSVRAEDFGFREGLSDEVRARAYKALQDILGLLEGEAAHA